MWPPMSAARSSLHGVTFLEVWEAMMIIEPQAAALAARKREPAQIEELETLHRLFESLAADRDRAVAIVVEFFRTLARCTQNHVLVLAQAPLTRLLSPTLGRMIDQVPQARSRIIAAQQRLIDAIRAAMPRKRAAGWRSTSATSSVATRSRGSSSTIA